MEHLVRQTVELALKALLEAIEQRSGEPRTRLLYSHNIREIWEHARTWLVENNYGVLLDTRVEVAEWLLLNLHEIEPLGDFFRFGISKRTAFGKRKSYDRVGLDLEVLIPDFNTTIDLLSFWEAAVTSEVICAELGWEKHPHFDPNDFPRRGSPDG